jgi:hypothetical protein
MDAADYGLSGNSYCPSPSLSRLGVNEPCFRFDEGKGGRAFMIDDLHNQSISNGYIQNLRDADISEVLLDDGERFDSLAVRKESYLLFLKLLVKIAENLRNAPEALSQLAQDEHIDVRIAVADNQHTPVATLSILARDEHTDVRYAVAENHNIPAHLLTDLAQDENPYVAARAQQTLNRITGGQIVLASFGKGNSPRATKTAVAL